MALTAPPRGSTPAQHQRSPGGHPGPVVGREAELAMLADAVSAIGGQSTAFLVVGEPGVGVSTLLRAATEQAASADCIVLTATGNENEEALPFAVLYRLLRSILGRAESLPPVQRQALQIAFGLAAGTTPDPFLVALGTLNLLTQSATVRPTVVVIDNLQWVDPASTEILTFVTRRVSDVPVVLLGGLRQGYSTAAYEKTFRQVTLERLDDHSAQRLLAYAAAHLTQEQSAQIRALSVGNPLALLELAANWPAALQLQDSPGRTPWISARLEQAFLGRFTDLPALTRDALLIAGIDETHQLSEILRATELFTGQMVTAAILDPAEQLSLLHFDEVHVQFRHPLLRKAITQRESVVRRQAAHRAWGGALSEPTARRAWHRSSAATGPDDSVADELEAVGQQAAALGQFPGGDCRPGTVGGIDHGLGRPRTAPVDRRRTRLDYRPQGRRRVFTGRRAAQRNQWTEQHPGGAAAGSADGRHLR